MRKCVSMVAAATAAVGLAGCSSPDRTREPAGAAQPLGTAPSPDAHTGNAGPAPLLGVAVPPPAAANQPPANVQRAPDGSTEDVVGAPAAGGSPDAPGSPAAPGAIPAAGNPAANPPAVNPGGPALAPSGTVPMAQPSGHAAPTGHAAQPKAALAKSSTIPPAALPAPPPPPPSSGSSGAGSQPSAMAQVLEAMAAAQSDGKPVLLDFGTGDSADSRALDAALRGPQTRAVLARSYHVVRVDPGSGDLGLLKLASQYAFGASGTPLLVVVSPDGTVRADSVRNGQPRLDDAGVAAWLRQWVR